MNNNQEHKILNLMKELIEKINQWNKEYYDKDAPSVSDEVYDKAMFELQNLETIYPEFKDKNSPTNFIGSNFDVRFNKVSHEFPMLSLNKAYSIEEIEKYIENIQKTLNIVGPTFVLEPKIDGLSIALRYENGNLIQAVTRGNGVIGEDVTHNALVINSIPKKIKYLQKVEVRGEVFLQKSDFISMNENIVKQADLEINELKENEKLFDKKTFEKKMNALLKRKEKLFVNPRNAASGSLRQLESSIVAQRNLQAIIYQLVEPLNHNVKTQLEALEFFKNNNFRTQEWIKTTTKLSQIKEYVYEFKELKNSFDYECDGLVIKYNEITQYDELGSTAKFPHHSIAFKYEIEKAITKLLNIKATVGRTGRITYNAVLEPVELNQTTVSAATLHNIDYIRDNKINVGDDVYVIKAGEIIPRVLAPVKPNSKSFYEGVSNCPECNSILGYIGENVDQYCLNDLCPEKIIRSIIHYASREALNIDALGEKTAELFFKKGIIKSIIDIYELKNHEEKLYELEGFKQKSIDNLLNSIEKSKKCYLFQVIYGLGIKQIGLQASKAIAKVVNSIEEFKNIEEETLLKIHDFGPRMIEEIKNYLSDLKNIEILNYLEKNLNIIIDQSTSDKLKGLTFVITGTLTKERNFFKKLIEDHGGKVSSSVSLKTNYLLAGENAGSKASKARSLNVAVISEKDFYNLIN